MSARDLQAGGELEQSVLGALLQDSSAIDAVRPLRAEHFVDSMHADVYSAIVALSPGADPISVHERMGAASPGLAYLQGLELCVPSARNVAAHARLLRDKANRRALGDALAGVAAAVHAGQDMPAALGAAREAISRADTESGAQSALIWEFAHELGDVDDAPDELVQGVITRGAMSVMYGDSNSGKTFAAIDLASAVARGMQWMGRQVDAGLVVYLAAESPASVRTRLRALQGHHGTKVADFAIVASPIDLFASDADVFAVIELVRELETATGHKCALLVGDTLARLSAGANENSGEDMGTVVRNVDYIRAATGAHFLLVHHCGKDAARGARGWSGLRAATDTEIEVTADDSTGAHCLEITKQRDLHTKGTRIGFRLQSVAMGLDKWGGLRTSCIVVGTDAPARVTKHKRTSEIAGAVTELLTQHGTGMKKGAVIKHFEGRYARQSIYREMTAMFNAGKLLDVSGIVALPGPQSAPQ